MVLVCDMCVCDKVLRVAAHQPGPAAQVFRKWQEQVHDPSFFSLVTANSLAPASCSCEVRGTRSPRVSFLGWVSAAWPVRFRIRSRLRKRNGNMIKYASQQLWHTNKEKNMATVEKL